MGRGSEVQTKQSLVRNEYAKCMRMQQMLTRGGSYACALKGRRVSLCMRACAYESVCLWMNELVRGIARVCSAKEGSIDRQLNRL
jgi:hypothetical protein